jgi:catechol 2,3-dioxygenase-like lactoylglutathione lyase family enzyme
MRASILPLFALVIACASQPAPCPSPPKSPPDTGFHDVTIVASNVAELREFYGKLGFEMAFSDADKLVVFIVGKNELAIHTSDQRPMNALGLTVLVEDLAKIQAKLREIGVPFEGPKPLRPGLTGVTVKDPNGNAVEFLHPD